MGDERKVVLAVSLIMYEFFQKLQPLNNQELITDVDEISEILEQYEISSHRIYHANASESPSADIFILKAQDDIYNVIDVVQRNMEFILVLTPRDSIVQAIQENYALFMKNNNLGGSGGDGKPKPPKSPKPKSPSPNSDAVPKTKEEKERMEKLQKKLSELDLDLF